MSLTDSATSRSCTLVRPIASLPGFAAMSLENKAPAPPLSGPTLGDEDAPEKLEPHVAHAVDASAMHVDDLLPPADAPTSHADAPAEPTAPATKLAPELLAYLGLRMTHTLIKKTIRVHVAPKTPAFLKEDLWSNAYTRALEAKWPPLDELARDRMLVTITFRAVVDHFRRDATHLRWLKRDVSPEDTAAPPVDEEPDPDDKWLLSNWLPEKVKDDPYGRETLDIIVRKARGNLSYEAMATELGVKPAALAQRIHRFKLDYLPIRNREDRKRELMMIWTTVVVVTGVALAVGILWWLQPWVAEWAPAEPSAHPVHVVRRYADDGFRDVATPTSPDKPPAP